MFVNGLFRHQILGKPITLLKLIHNCNYQLIIIQFNFKESNISNVYNIIWWIILQTHCI